jgi:uncharacterized MAPEG superfamily protein
MKPELMYLAYTALLTALLWLPYIVNRTMVYGLRDAMGYPSDPKPVAAWADRAKKAHYNAVENLVVFAPLVVLASMTGKADNAVVTSSMVYFWARVAHYIIYTAGIPYLRTISFTIGWLACICIFWQVVH